ncbi:MAG: glycosyltransferase family 2 protein [Haloarculaceae archaeon]
MPNPTVSIITPSFNQAEYIGETLDSVKFQDYPNIEHIVMDGGSSDGTVEILKEYENSYGLEWVSQSDGGQANAINNGFQRAKGDVLGWLNSDDVYISESAVSQLVDALTRYPNADLVNGRGIRLEEDSKWDHPIKRRDHKLSYSGLKQVASVLQPATFWYDYVWEDLGINDGLEYAFDWDFFIRATEKFNLVPISDFLIGYRWQGDNKTTHGGLERAEEIRNVTGKYLGRNSWQYQLLCIYCGVYKMSNYLPDALGKHIEEVLEFFSNVVSYLSLKQISGV